MDCLVKPKAPRIPWGRKKIRVKIKTSQAKEEIGTNHDAEPERR